MAKKTTKSPAVAKRRLPKPKPKPEARRLPLSEPPASPGSAAIVLDRLWAVIVERRTVDPAVSHSARLLSRGVSKVAQKFGEEAVECLIEAVAGNADLIIAESADVLYHLLVLWVATGVEPGSVWAELERREGISGVTEKAARVAPRAPGISTRKIP